MTYNKVSLYIGKQLNDILDDVKKALNDYWQSTNNINMFEKDGISLVLSSNYKRPVELLDIERLRYELSRLACWYKPDGKDKVDVIPPDFICKSMLAMPGSYFKPLKGICYGPIIGKQGDWINDTGYHMGEEIYRTFDLVNTSYMGRKETFTDDLAEARQLADKARGFIWDEVLDEVIFESNADKTNFISAMFLPFVIRYIDDATMVLLIEAAKNNSGKSTLGHFPGLISTGVQVPTITPEPDTTQDAFSKLVTSKLMEAPSIVFIDNVDFEIKSSRLCSVISESVTSDRLLTTNKMIDLEAKTQWIITGNHLRMSDQFARRTMRAKIAKSVDGRTFKRDNLKQWVITNRAKIVGAICDILQLWRLEGFKEGEVKASSFQKFSMVMSGIMACAGFPDFLKDYRSIQMTYDKVESDLTTFVHSWARAGGAKSKMTELMIIADREQLFVEQITGQTAASRLAQFSKLMNQHLERDIDGFAINIEENKHTKQKTLTLTSKVKGKYIKPPSNLVRLTTGPDTLTHQLQTLPAIPEQDSESD